MSVATGIGIIQALFSSGRLKIHSGCTNLINEIFLYSYENEETDDSEDSSGKNADKIEKINDHACDAMRYALISCGLINAKGKKIDTLLEESFGL